LFSFEGVSLFHEICGQFFKSCSYCIAGDSWREPNVKRRFLPQASGAAFWKITRATRIGIAKFHAAKVAVFYLTACG